MLTFRFEGRSREGQPVEGTLRAESALDALRQVESRGLRPIRVEGARRGRGGSESRSGRGGGGGFFSPIRRWHLIVFTRELLTVYRSGINMLAGLDILARQAAHDALRPVILDIRSAVEAGASLSDALSRHPKLFSEFYRGAVMAGEKSGSLEEVLKEIVRYLEEQEKTANEIRTAVRYPSFVAVALAIAVTVILAFVFPRMQPLFRRFGDDLPLPTAILVGSATAVREHWVLIAAGAAAFAVALAAALRTRSVRLRADTLLLHVPLVGPVVRGVLTARLAATLSLLQRSGLPLLTALDVAAGVVRSPSFASDVRSARRAVAEGSAFGDALSECPNVPALFAQMAALGERTGRLDDLLGHVAEHYRQEVRDRLARLIATIEPLLTAALASFILFFALAIFLPYWNMIKALK